MVKTEARDALMRITRHLREIDREMPVSRLQILLLVAQADQTEGALVRNLVKATGMNQSSIARALDKLGAHEAESGFVESRLDPEDPRRVRVFVTRHGQTLLDELAAMLG